MSEEAKFTIGEVVRRISDGSTLTIEDVMVEGGIRQYLCSWTEEGEFHRDLILETKLQKIAG